MLTARPRLLAKVQDGRSAAFAAGRRRALVRRPVIRATYPGQGGGYPPDPDVADMLGLRARRGPMGQRRVVRQPRDLQQLMDLLTGGGSVEDPEQFLRLVSAAPRVLDRRRVQRPVRPPPPAPPPPPPQTQVQDPAAAAAAYKILQQQQQAAAEAEAARRRAQLEAQQQQQLRMQQQQQQQQQQQEEEERRRAALREAMLQNARRHLPQYDAASLARLANALAAAGVHDTELCDDMVRQLVSAQQQQPPRQQPQRMQPQQQQRLLEPRSVADLLDAFAAMRHRPTDAQIAELLRLHQAQQQLQQQQQQQLLQQQKAAELQRLRQQQQQQQLRLQPRGLGMPAQAAPPSAESANSGASASASGGSETMSPDDAARMLYALSRLGYTPDERTLGQLLEQLQPQRLRLQPLPAVEPGGASRDQASAGVASARPTQRMAVPAPAPAAAATPRGRAPSPGVAGAGPGLLAEGAATEDDEDQLSYSLQRDAQAVASAVRALERMGRLGEAAQLRERFMRHVQEVQARVAADRRERRRQEQVAAAAAAQAAERERRAVAEAEAVERQRERERERQAAEAAAAAAQAERERRAVAEAEAQAVRQQRQEEQARALREQLRRKLRTADGWQQIRVLLVTYQEALDIECMSAAAARLSELLAAARRTGRGLGLRDRGELGDLLEGLGEMALRRLEGASASQAASLLTSVVRMRYLEERLLVGLLRRLRDTLDDATAGELAAVLGSLAECGVRPTPPWMETFLRRCEDLLEDFTSEDLAALPVCLAQLGAHPGRSWLGSYLDVLQEREGELSQSCVSEAVHAVALLDRQFLAAWRQAAAVRQQQQQQQQARALREQAQLANTEAAAAAAERAAAARQTPPASALASVDETLSRPEPQQLWDERAAQVDEGALPPMHPKQRSMEEMSAGQAQALAQPDSKADERQGSSQEAGVQQPSSSARRSPAGPTGGRLPPVGAATQSIELDVDSAELPYAEWAVPSSAAVQPQAEEATAAAGSAAASEALPSAATSSAVPPTGGRQLPGSYSIDGYYSLDPFDEYEAFDEFDEWEGAEEGEAEAAPLENESLALDEEVVAAMADAKARAGGQAPSAAPGDVGASSAASVGAVAEQQQQRAQQQQAQPQAAGQQQPQAAGTVGVSRMSINLSPGMVGASGRQAPQQQPMQQQERQPQQPAAMRSVDVPEWEDAAREVKVTQPPQPSKAPQAQGPKSQSSQPPHAPKPQQPKPEDLAQARALRSLLLERYEAVAAFKDEVEARRQRAAAGAAAGGAGDDGVPTISGRDAALAARYLTAREQLQRLQADYDNFKRRDSIERKQATARAKADVLKPLLGLADNFERAATQIKPKTDGERAVHEAYQNVYTELKSLFEREGLEEVGKEGEAFDPNQHEAVMREDRSDVPDGTVTGVFQKGYRLGELLIRPALVKVSYS